MKFVVLADDQRWEALRAAAPAEDWKRVNDIAGLLSERGDAFFNLQEDSSREDYKNITAPVFLNSTVITLKEMNAPANLIRINAWPGFIEKEIWETAGQITPAAAAAMETLHKKNIRVNDEPGFVSARVIAMIINEAFFAKGENVSSEEDIDIAMKLGTNYPYGPFEWARKIGLQNVYALLKKLSAEDPRYMPAPGLEKEIPVRP